MLGLSDFGLQYFQNISSLPMKYPLSFIIICAFLLFHVQGNLSVYNAQSLGLNSKDLGLENINFSIANFGFVPFGKTMIGQLVVSPNFSDQCNFVEDSQINSDQNYFMIVPRGNCKFVPKALNAQKAGAKMVIVMDNETYSEPFIMADNGEGYKVKIPTIFVNHSDGQNLINTIKQVKQRGQKLIVKIYFQNQKTEKVQLKLYLQSNNRRSYKLVNDFQQFYETINPFINLKVVYHTEYCSFCLSQDCYFGEEYCSYQYRKEEGATGKDILDQEIREMIVLQKAPEKWWGWMSYIGDECTKISELKECSEDGMRKVGINVQSIQQAFSQSFSKDGNNKYLQSSAKGLESSGVTKYPAVAINGYYMRGTISAEYLFDDICNTLSSPPEGCEKYVNETVVVTFVKEYWLLVFIIIVLGFVIFSGLVIFQLIKFILYKRYMKRRMSVDMKNRVDDMVSKYIEFYSERAGRN